MITATLTVEMLLFRKPLDAAARVLGLGRPAMPEVLPSRRRPASPVGRRGAR